MADLAHWDKDEAWIIEASFAVNGVPTNPTAVTATARKPDKTTEAYTVGSGITNTAAGTYRVTDTGDQVGTWYIEVIGTGAAAGRARHQIIIDPRWPSDLLKPIALTSIEDVELLLDRVGLQGSRGDEEDDDRLIAFYINAFSEQIQRYTRRQFLPLEANTAKVFRYDGSNTLSLAPSEARSISEIRFNTDQAVSAQQVITADSYRSEPRQKSESGTYLGLVLPTTLVGSSSYWADIQVSITGNWGAGIVPDAVQYVCAAEAANAYMRATQRAPRGVAAEDFLGPDIGPFPLSRRSMAVLDDYVNGR
ncbi:MAG TPA: hypothetical protein VNJ54_16795, partial [Plantibacter sp.]|uniref:hypothetical protein n=1 Tax=Plantibacter sp. TaxID=1871045 RepID=UPI002CFA5656|nr:hypothetical protein [Plantibacter sp.]